MKKQFTEECSGGLEGSILWKRFDVQSQEKETVFLEPRECSYHIIGGGQQKLRTDSATAPSVEMSQARSWGRNAKGALWWLQLSNTLILVTQSSPTLCDPMDCSPPGSSVSGILQARILEWVAMPFSRGSQHRDQSWVSWIGGRFFTIWATRGSPIPINTGKWFNGKIPDE